MVLGVADVTREEAVRAVVSWLDATLGLSVADMADDTDRNEDLVYDYLVDTAPQYGLRLTEDTGDPLP